MNDSFDSDLPSLESLYVEGNCFTGFKESKRNDLIMRSE